MKKSFKSTFSVILALVLCCQLLAAALPVGAAEAGTETGPRRF